MGLVNKDNAQNEDNNAGLADPAAAPPGQDSPSASNLFSPLLDLDQPDNRILAGTLLAAVALCWLRLASDPPWYNLVGEFTDEAFYTANVQCMLKIGRWQAGYLDQSWSSPVLQAVLLGWGRVFGIGYASVKALNALVASLTLALVAMFGVRHVGPRRAALLVAMIGLNSVFFVVRRTFCPEAFHLLLITPGYFLLLERRWPAYFMSGLCLALAVGIKLSAFYSLFGACLFVLVRVLIKRMSLHEALLFALPLMLFFTCYAAAYFVMKERWAMSIEQQALQINLLEESLMSKVFAVFTAGVLTADLGAMLPVLAAGVWIVRTAAVEGRLFRLRNTEPRAELTALLLCWIFPPLIIGLINPEYMNRRLLPLLVPLCLISVMPWPQFPKTGLKARLAGAFSKLDLWLLLALGNAFYAAWLMFWCLNVNFLFLYRLKFDVFDIPSASDTERACILAACAIVGLFVLAVQMTSNPLFLKRTRQIGAAIYIAWWCLVSGSCILKPTYTVADASSSLAKFVRRGDMMGFIQSEANQGFVLCMNNDAVPYFVPGNHPELARERPAGLRMRLLSRTLERRTPWEWRIIPPISRYDKLILETPPIIVNLVPMPFGKYSHKIEIVVLKEDR